VNGCWWWWWAQSSTALSLARIQRTPASLWVLINLPKKQLNNDHSVSYQRGAIINYLKFHVNIQNWNPGLQTVETGFSVLKNSGLPGFWFQYKWGCNPYWWWHSCLSLSVFDQPLCSWSFINCFWTDLGALTCHPVQVGSCHVRRRFQLSPADHDLDCPLCPSTELTGRLHSLHRADTEADHSHWLKNLEVKWKWNVSVCHWLQWWCECQLVAWNISVTVCVSDYSDGAVPVATRCLPHTTSLYLFTVYTCTL